MLAEGDPMFYGSFMYLHDRLSPLYPTEVVPGVTALSGATAVAAQPLSRHEDVLTVLPGTLPVPELARRLADTDAAVIMKLGRTFAAVREALHQAGLLERAIYVERATRDGQRILPVAEVAAETVPYMSIVVVPGLDRRADSGGRAPTRHGGPGGSAAGARGDAAYGTVHVVGLGPGPDRWLAPEAQRGARRGGSRRGLRAVCRPGAPAAGADPSRERQHRRGGPGAARPRPRPGR